MYFSSKQSADSLPDKDLRATSRVIKHLRSEKFIVATAGSKKKGFYLTGKPKFSVNRDGPDYSKLMSKYFDPTAKIAHHVRGDYFLKATPFTDK